MIAPTEGVTRCSCGSKYWDDATCASCGERWTPWLFPHQCETAGCTRIVDYDDEPRCFQHSPDSGSAVAGYSARRKAESL